MASTTTAAEAVSAAAAARPAAGTAKPLATLTVNDAGIRAPQVPLFVTEVYACDTSCMGSGIPASQYSRNVVTGAVDAQRRRQQRNSTVTFVDDPATDRRGNGNGPPPVDPFADERPRVRHEEGVTVLVIGRSYSGQSVAVQVTGWRPMALVDVPPVPSLYERIQRKLTEMSGIGGAGAGAASAGDAASSQAGGSGGGGVSLSFDIHSAAQARGFELNRKYLLHHVRTCADKFCSIARENEGLAPLPADTPNPYDPRRKHAYMRTRFPTIEAMNTTANRLRRPTWLPFTTQEAQALKTTPSFAPFLVSQEELAARSAASRGGRGRGNGRGGGWRGGLQQQQQTQPQPYWSNGNRGGGGGGGWNGTRPWTRGGRGYTATGGRSGGGGAQSRGRGGRGRGRDGDGGAADDENDAAVDAAAAEAARYDTEVPLRLLPQEFRTPPPAQKMMRDVGEAMRYGDWALADAVHAPVRYTVCDVELRVTFDAFVRSQQAAERIRTEPPPPPPFDESDVHSAVRRRVPPPCLKTASIDIEVKGSFNAQGVAQFPVPQHPDNCIYLVNFVCETTGDAAAGAEPRADSFIYVGGCREAPSEPELAARSVRFDKIKQTVTLHVFTSEVAMLDAVRDHHIRYDADFMTAYNGKFDYTYMLMRYNYLTRYNIDTHRAGQRPSRFGSWSRLIDVFYRPTLTQAETDALERDAIAFRVRRQNALTAQRDRDEDSDAATLATSSSSSSSSSSASASSSSVSASDGAVAGGGRGGHGRGRGGGRGGGDVDSGERAAKQRRKWDRVRKRALAHRRVKTVDVGDWSKQRWTAKQNLKAATAAQTGDEAKKTAATAASQKKKFGGTGKGRQSTVVPMIGRTVLDAYRVASVDLLTMKKYKTLTLEAVMRHEFGADNPLLNKIKLDYADQFRLYERGLLLRLIEYCTQDAICPLRYLTKNLSIRNYIYMSRGTARSPQDLTSGEQIMKCIGQVQEQAHRMGLVHNTHVWRPRPPVRWLENFAGQGPWAYHLQTWTTGPRRWTAGAATASAEAATMAAAAAPDVRRLGFVIEQTTTTTTKTLSATADGGSGGGGGRAKWLAQRATATARMADAAKRSKAKGKGKRARYGGAAVLTPKEGLYSGAKRRYTADVDVDSMYPNNMCSARTCPSLIPAETVSLLRGMPPTPGGVPPHLLATYNLQSGTQVNIVNIPGVDGVWTRVQEFNLDNRQVFKNSAAKLEAQVDDVEAQLVAAEQEAAAAPSKASTTAAASAAALMATAEDAADADARRQAVAALRRRLVLLRESLANDKAFGDVLKTQANSLYGLAGALTGELSWTEIAELVTELGQHILYDIRDIVNQWRSPDGVTFVDVYGDTDSLFFEILGAASADDAHRASSQLLQHVNACIGRKYGPRTRAKLEKVLFALFMQRKKKWYFCLPWNEGKKGARGQLAPREKVVARGVEYIKSSTLPMTARFQETVVDRMYDYHVDVDRCQRDGRAPPPLAQLGAQCLAALDAVLDALVRDALPLDQYVQAGRLTTNPEQADKLQPHGAAWLKQRLRMAGSENPIGSKQDYVVCTDVADERHLTPLMRTMLAESRKNDVQQVYALKLAVSADGRTLTCKRHGDRHQSAVAVYADTAKFVAENAALLRPDRQYYLFLFAGPAISILAHVCSPQDVRARLERASDALRQQRIGTAPGMSGGVNALLERDEAEWRRRLTRTPAAVPVTAPAAPARTCTTTTAAATAPPIRDGPSPDEIARMLQKRFMCDADDADDGDGGYDLTALLEGADWDQGSECGDNDDDDQCKAGADDAAVAAIEESSGGGMKRKRECDWDDEESNLQQLPKRLCVG